MPTKRPLATSGPGDIGHRVPAINQDRTADNILRFGRTKILPNSVDLRGCETVIGNGSGGCGCGYRYPPHRGARRPARRTRPPVSSDVRKCDKQRAETSVRPALISLTDYM
ncbi:hypothetical protein J6590_026993 [Homalodisca vitripennis]|nr:hypothetical protein J6590_026993 [Homalodisca vitripennis]